MKPLKIWAHLWRFLPKSDPCGLKDFFWFFEMEELGASEANNFNYKEIKGLFKLADGMFSMQTNGAS